MSHKERKGNSFIKQPIYPGGMAAFRKFVKDNLQYPKAAIEAKVEGTVFLDYTIDHKGNVTETKVVKGVSQGCSAEAERIIKLMKFEIPKNPRKLRVTFKKKTQITFKLPKKKAIPASQPTAPPKAKRVSPTPVPPATQTSKTEPIRFKIVPTKPVPKKANQASKKKKVYTYTISGNIEDLMG